MVTASTATTNNSPSSAAQRALKMASKLFTPSTAWTLVFGPALAYVLVTRMGHYGFRSNFGQAITSQLQLPSADETYCSDWEEAFYLARDCRSSLGAASSDTASDTTATLQSKYALQLVHSSSALQGLVATCWRHDSELGRGYLLLSQAAGNGNIWRWEVGGGPIAIGRTLHLQQAGCRSNQGAHTCAAVNETTAESTDSTKGAVIINYYDSDNWRTGSGGIAIDFHTHEHAAEGTLVIAEWGEGRIIRVEENGARTPLVIQVPTIPESDDVCDAAAAVAEDETITTTTDDGEQAEDIKKEEETTTTAAILRRVDKPRSLLYTPTGDLLFVDEQTTATTTCGDDDGTVDTAEGSHRQPAVYRLPQAVHVPALSSLLQSRQAHAWSEVQAGNWLPEIFYAIPDVTQIGGIAHAPSVDEIYISVQMNDGSVVLMSVPLATDDDDEDEEEDASPKKTPRQIVNVTESIPTAQTPGALTVSHAGRVYLATEQGVVIIHPLHGVVLGTIPMTTDDDDNDDASLLFPTSLTFGEDGFLYMTTHDRLYRMAVRDKPVTIPTDKVKRLSKKRTVQEQ